MTYVLLTRRGRRRTADYAGEFRGDFGSTARTSVFLSGVRDPGLRQAIDDFDEALEAVLTESLAVHGLVLHEPDGDAVGAVSYIARVLGLPESDVLAAASIKERTFHEWKGHGRKPRLASQGALWKLVQGVEDLASVLPQPSRWILAEPDRRGRFRAGDVDDLVAEAAAELSPDSETSAGGLTSGIPLADEGLDVPPLVGRSPVRRPTRLRRRLSDTGGE